MKDEDDFNQTEETIDFLNKKITDALIRMSSFADLTPEQAKHVGNLFHVINDLERIGDHATNIGEWAEFTVDGIHRNGDSISDLFNPDSL